MSTDRQIVRVLAWLASVGMIGETVPGLSIALGRVAAPETIRHAVVRLRRRGVIEPGPLGKSPRGVAARMWRLCSR